MAEILFGRIIHGGQVADAVRDTLQTWLSTFLAEAEDQWGLEKGYLGRPGAYVRTTDLEQVPPVGKPLIAIRASGGSATDRDGDGQISSSEQITVRAYVKGRNRDESLDHAAMYAAAIFATIEGKPSLGGFADSAWAGPWEYVPLTWRDRTLAAAEIVVRVDVPNIATRSAGPDTPEPEPPDVPDFPTYEDPPEAETVNVTIAIQEP